MVTYPFLRAIPVTFSPLVGAADVGDVLADTQEIANAIRQEGGRGYLVGLKVLDRDDQTAADMEVWILNENVSLGTEGAAITISDDNMDKVVAIVAVDSTAFIDGDIHKCATLGLGDAGFPKPVWAAPGQTSLFAGIVTRGTPTQTASGLRLTFIFSDAI